MGFEKTAHDRQRESSGSTHRVSQPPVKLAGQTNLDGWKAPFTPTKTLRESALHRAAASGSGAVALCGVKPRLVHRGTLIGGVALGVAQSLGGMMSPQFSILTGHIVFLAVLAARLTQQEASERGGWRAAWAAQFRHLQRK